MVNQTEHTLDKLIRVLRDGSWEERCSAAETLGNLGDRRAVQPLIGVVSNRFGDHYGHPDYRELRDWIVREKAAEALGKLGDEQAIRPLIEAFKDRSGHVWGAAIRALGQIGKPALRFLLDALENTDCAVRLGAVSALGWLGGQRSFKAILTMLQDSEPLVRYYAIDALFQCGGTQTVDFLLDALRQDETNRVAASVLATVSDDRATQFLEQAKRQNIDKVDPELTIEVLEIRLCALAGAFRGSSDLPEQERIVQEYHAAMNKLYFLGWNRSLYFECELPDEFMPEEYLQRHPKLPNDAWLLPKK